MGISILIILAGIILSALVYNIYIQRSNLLVEVKDEAIPLEKVMPIQSIENDCIINGNGDITVGYELLLPEVFTLTENASQQLFTDLEGLMKMLPTGTVVHQQLNFHTEKYENENIGDIQNFIQKENISHYEGRDILQCSCYLYFTFSDQSSGRVPRKEESCLLRKKNIPFTLPFQGIEKRLIELEGYIINLDDALHNMQLEVHRMDSLELGNKLYDILNSSYEKPTSDATTEVVSPMFVSEDGSLKIGDKHVAILSLVEEGAILHPITKKPKIGSNRDGKISMPQNISSKCCMTFPLGLGLPFNHTLNIIVEITDNDKSISKLSKDSYYLNPLVQVYKPAEDKKNEIKSFCDAVTKNGWQTTYTAVNLIISDEDKNSLARKVSQSKTAFSNMNQSKAFCENVETANVFFTSLPGNARSNYRGFVSTLHLSLSYFVKESLYLSDASGYLFLDRFGKPCIIDMMQSKHIFNKNRILIGPSGSGKSYWLNNYILQSLTMQQDVVIIDIGGSYKSMIALNGGKYFDSRESSTFSFNPFLVPQDKDGNYMCIDNSDTESKDDIIEYISTIIAVIWKPSKSGELLPATSLAILKNTIREFYKYINQKKIFPCLDSYVKFIENELELDESSFKKFDKTELVIMLRAYTTQGEFPLLLNASSNLDITNDRLIAFDLEDAKTKSYFPIVIVIILNLVAEKIKQREGITKKLIIDEGFDFLQDEKMGGFIAYLYRTFRKKEGEVFLAAQNCKFIDACPPDIKNSILINSDTKILLDHSNARGNYSDLNRILSITEDEINMLDSLQKTNTYREFYIKLGKQSGIFRNEVSVIADAAFDSQQATIVEIRRLFKECGSTQAALVQYVANKNKKSHD